jgi:hypothetical protein
MVGIRVDNNLLGGPELVDTQYSEQNSKIHMPVRRYRRVLSASTDKGAYFPRGG